MRNATRQRMHRLVNERAAEELVGFVDKPKHRHASTLGDALSEADIRKTIEIVRQLIDDVTARAERLS